MAGDTGQPHLDRDTVALFTPVSNGKVLAAVCALNKIPADVIETPPTGSFAVLANESEGAAADAAGILSAFLKTVPLLAMERRAGQISISQWRSGSFEKDLPPGLALDQAPHAITKLMMGTATIEQIKADNPEKVHDGHVGRWTAFWQLRRLAAQAKRERGA